MTPKEAADFARADNREKVKEFLFNATARELQEFIHLIGAFNTTQAFNLARVALDIRIAEGAANTAQKLSQQTETLVHHSENLTKQTDRLVQETIKLTRFTRGVFWLTITLGVFALAQIVFMGVQIVIMLFEHFSKNY